MRTVHEENAFNILLRQGNCNDLKAEQIVSDLQLAKQHFETFYIQTNGSWYDTLYIDPIDDGNWEHCLMAIALAFSWKANEIHWVSKNPKHRIFIKASPIQEKQCRPEESILRIWWD